MYQARLNRSGEMEVFARVVEAGGFSRAAQELGLSQSAVSKLISRLESRLGVRLFNRSTRHLDLTAEGCVFYERSMAILSDIAEAEREAAGGEELAGRVRLNTSASYAAHVLEPVLSEFLERYPNVTLDIALTDSVIDLLAERTDVVVRAGPLRNSSLVARKLGETSMVMVAAPTYLERFGVPLAASDLQAHFRIDLGYNRVKNGWRLQSEDSAHVGPHLRLHISDGEALRRMAIRGLGLARLAEFTVRDDIAEGRLHRVLVDVCPADREVFHAIYTGQGGPLPARVRAVLDFLAEYGTVR